MINIGQIEFKNQYGLKRKIYNHNKYGLENSLLSGSVTVNSKNNFKSLMSSENSRVSFKGYNYYQKLLKPAVKVVPKNISDKVFDSLKNISNEQFLTYSKIKNEYLNFVKNNPIYCKKNGIDSSLLKKIVEEDVLIYLPQKKVVTRFVEQLFSPVTALYSWGEKLLLPKTSKHLIQKKEQDAIIKNYAALEGLIKSHEIWENGYRKLTGHSKLREHSKFLIPDDVLYSKINRRRNKVVDPNKGKYSSNSLMIGNRLISGIIYSYFLGTDAYNTTIRYSNDKNEAALQRKSRVAQEFSRIGMNMYIQNLLFGTFESAVNKSLPTAMFVSGSTVAFSEILGRKLVGKPIMPSNKENLDRLEKEMAEKKGILPAVGRLLTNAKKRSISSNNVRNITLKLDSKQKANNRLFSAFAEKTNQPSFKGLHRYATFFKVDNFVEKSLLRDVYKIIEEADSKIAQNVKDIIMKSVKKSAYYSENNLPVPNTFEELLANDKITKIPLGKNETVWGKFIRSVLVPIDFVKGIVVSITKNVQKLIQSISGNKRNLLADELSALREFAEKYKNNSLDSSFDKVYIDKAVKRAAKFEEFLKDRLKLDAWHTSPFSLQEKELKIFSEFKSIKNKDNEDIQGIKNILLWFDKQISKEGIKIQKDGTLSKAHKDRVKEILMESVMKADGEKQLEYDGNTLAQTNINLSRAITTLFLVTDAYNLTMQYSNDNKKDAHKSAKNRAAQEISRIGVSAYIMAFVHNLLSRLCNSSLGGAFTLTALTSTINDSISRKVVGVPLTAKTHEQLELIDEENLESKNPIRKALAYSIGKKSVLAGLKSNKINNSNPSDYYFLNDYFVNPHIS